MNKILRHFCIGSMLVFVWMLHEACSMKAGQKYPINGSHIDSAFIAGDLNVDDTIAVKPCRLTSSQTDRFCLTWNEGKSEGPCKYMPRYILTLYLDDGSARKFFATGGTAHDDLSDECYQLENDHYFDELYHSSQ